MSIPKPRLVTLTAVLGAVTLLAAACARSPETGTGTTQAPTEVVLMTHDSFDISAEILDAFTEETGVAVRILRAGDAGLMLNQAILTKDNPLADVIFGIDNTFLSRALDEELFLSYESPGLASVPDELILDPQHRVTPIDFGDVCLNYDKSAFLDLPVPLLLEDLTDERYRGRLVVESPATSSPGLAFLLATIGRFPEGSEYEWRQYWADLTANDVLVTSGWEEAYYGEFSGGSGEGTRPLVVSYASSPPAEVFFSELTEAPTGVISDGCFRQIEFAGILQGTSAEGPGRQLIDFMLAPRFQEDIPLKMFVFPANREASLPEVFIEHTIIPEAPIVIDPKAIEANRERWIEEWARIVR